MKIIFYVIAALGVIALALGIYWLVKDDHHLRQYVALVVGVVLLVGGLIAAFTTKPKTPAIV